MPEHSLTNLQLGENTCFLCGSRSNQQTQEHVFPKWLQQRYNLWNQTLGLLNGTRIRYKSLLIPCCATCNGKDLSRLETSVSGAISSGHVSSSDFDVNLLYLWAGKLYFGILRREITLARERSRPQAGTILEKRHLQSFSALHLFLQGIRGNHEFMGTPPYSVLVCNLHDVGQARHFCFRDSLFHATLAIRLGEVGIIVALEDAGLTANTYGRYVQEVAGRKLHPIQFDELYAKVLYQVSLIEGGLKYITLESHSGAQPARTHVISNGTLRERSQEEYSRLLRTMVSDWLRPVPDDVEWFVPPDLVPTWMTDEKGALLLQPLSAWEARGTA